MHQYGEYQGRATFLYRKNLQGDITGIIEASTGILVAEYSYDAYGNVKFSVADGDLGASLLGAIVTVCNPLLYRGYIYSILGGSLAYYLGSRFYLPQLGRFLNADKHTDTQTGVVGTNMYAYCNNNPVMFTDPSGEEGVAISSGIVVLFTAIGLAIVITLLANEILKLLPSLSFSSIKRSIETLTEGKIQTIKLIRTFVKSLSKAMANYVELVISEALAKAKQSNLNNKRYDVHHIVAKKALAAIYGRLVLASVDISVEDQINKVAIKYRLHAYLNTNSYNTGVGLFLLEVYTKASKNNQRTQVENALLFLKIALLSASTIVP